MFLNVLLLVSFFELKVTNNPHLLKSVIDHYELKGLGSNIRNSFKSFEQIDRLVVAEEKARIAQANN